MNKRLLPILPLILFLFLVLSVGYLLIGRELILTGSPTATPTVTTGISTTEAKATEGAGIATAKAVTATAEASATAAAKATATAEAQQTATAEANKTATANAATATAEISATAAAKATATAEAQQTATAEINETAMAKTAAATAEASATAAAKATATAEAQQTATAEANKTATAKAVTATAEASATAAAKATETAVVVVPESTPDAIVNAPNGVALLRSGPGDDYETIATLPEGTALEILRRVYHKNDWIKVAVNSDSDERIDGYMNIASGVIKVNVPLEDFSPIYEFGPALYEPKQNETRAVAGFITFKWGDYGQLEEHQYYSLLLVRDDLSEGEACYHWQVKVPEETIVPKDFGCTPGVYYWKVGIATKMLGEDGKPILGEDGKPLWRDDSEKDERNIIGLGVPPPDRPEDGGSGGGGDIPLGGVDPDPF